jgi:hypothetical protein
VGFELAKTLHGREVPFDIGMRTVRAGSQCPQFLECCGVHPVHRLTAHAGHVRVLPGSLSGRRRPTATPSLAG